MATDWAKQGVTIVSWSAFVPSKDNCGDLGSWNSANESFKPKSFVEVAATNIYVRKSGCGHMGIIMAKLSSTMVVNVRSK